jgi:hypothetical protein
MGVAKDVLIIGAGASVPFGVANGLSMMDQIADEIENELSHWQAVYENKRGSQLESFLLSRVVTDWTEEEFFELHAETVDILEQLKSLFLNQTSDTIDDLVRMNPPHGDLLKRAIAYCVFARIYKMRTTEYLGHIFKLVNLEARQIESHNGKKQRNWIHHFINLCRQRALDARPEDIPTIISFNYDGVLEYVLERQWNNVNNRQLPQWQHIIKIVHPHGVMKIEEVNCDIAGAVSIIKNWAAQIRIVDETKLAEHSEVVECRCLIHNAHNIYAAGFAFAAANCKLIGFSEGMFGESGPKKAPKLHFINYDDSYGLRERVNRYCSQGEGGSNFIERRPDRIRGVLEIDEAIASGFLGEMPA